MMPIKSEQMGQAVLGLMENVWKPQSELNVSPLIPGECVTLNTWRGQAALVYNVFQTNCLQHRYHEICRLI